LALAPYVSANGVYIVPAQGSPRTPPLRAPTPDRPVATACWADTAWSSSRLTSRCRKQSANSTEPSSWTPAARRPICGSRCTTRRPATGDADRAIELAARARGLDPLSTPALVKLAQQYAPFQAGHELAFQLPPPVRCDFGSWGAGGPSDTRGPSASRLRFSPVWR